MKVVAGKCQWLVLDFNQQQRMENKMEIEIVIDVCECSGDEEYLAVSGEVLVCQSCGESQPLYTD